MKQQKLVLIGPAHPFRGGIAHFADALASQLNSRSFEITIFNFSRLYPGVIFPGKTQFEPEIQLDKYVRRVSSIDSIGPHTWFATAGKILEERPDGVLFQYWEPFFAPAFGTIARLLRRERIKVFCVVHNALPHGYRPFAIGLGRYGLGSCNQVVALSDRVEHDLRCRLKVKIPITRLFHPLYEDFGKPIETVEARTRLQLDQRQPVVLFFGLVRRYKGLGVLLEAMTQIKRVLPEIKLIVAGEIYDDRRKHLTFVEARGLGKHVTFEDRYIPQSQVARYFSAADLIILPYLSGTQSGVLSIAYHFECPFLASNIDGLANMAFPEAIVDAGNANALAGAVLRFFTKNQSAEFRALMKRKKNDYTWERFCTNLEEIVLA